MSEPGPSWKVLPHSPLQEIDDGLLTVTGQIRMPVGQLPRRMTVVRLLASRLLVWSAIALEEASMARLESLGTPAFLIVPNAHHRLDAKAWKERYPQMLVVAPSGARAKVAKKVPVDTTAPQFADPNVRFHTVDGTNAREAALTVHTANGTTLVLNDLVGNIRDASGVSGWFLRKMGFAGSAPQVPKIVRLAIMKNVESLRNQLLLWAQIDSLQRILVSHGEPIDGNPRQALRELANSIG